MFIISYILANIIIIAFLAYVFLYENRYKDLLKNPKMKVHENELKSTKIKIDKLKSYVKYLSKKEKKKAYLLIFPTSCRLASCYKNVIIIDKGLIASLPVKHLYSIIAHEFGHIKYNMFFFRFLISSSIFALLSTTMYILILSNHKTMNTIDLIIVGLSLLSCFLFVLDLDIKYFRMTSKKREFFADRYASSQIDPFLLIESLDKLRTELDPPINIPSESHPSVLERFERLASYSQKKGEVPN